jgi:hypothetical protein
MGRQPYMPPVSHLLLSGETNLRTSEEWPDYVAELGLTQEDIPELIRLATDKELHFDTDLDDPASWAAVHAWHALGQLHAEAAIEPLLATLEWDSDWAAEDVPKVYGMIGPAAIPALAEYIAGEHDDEYAITHAAMGLLHIAERFPKAREQAIAPIISRLERYEENTPTQNAFLISDLEDLKAVEAASLMKQALDAKAVDESVVGDWDDVQYALGLRDEPPPKRKPLLPGFLPNFDMDIEAGFVPASHSPQKHSPARKAKVKMAKASRKQNRKKQKHK